MRRILIVLLFFNLFFVPKAFADYTNMSQLEEDKLIYLAATTCKSAYSDRAAVAIDNLRKLYPVEVEPFVIENALLNTSFSLTKFSDKERQKQVYMLCFRGSENSKDWKINFKYDKVPYTENKDPNTPQVHEGFKQYLDFVLAQKNANGTLLSQMLVEETDADILITGHSLGGAIATLYTANLLDMGVDPNRIFTITFGAPAVGNQAFADLYKNKANILRITSSQDLVPVSLKKFVGGYAHFGRHRVFQADVQELDYYDQHDMGFYLNESITNFIDDINDSVKTGQIPSLPKQSITEGSPLLAISISTAPRLDKLPNSEYMAQTVELQLRSFVPSYLFLPEVSKKIKQQEQYGYINKLLKLSKEANAQYLLMIQVDGESSKTSKKKAIILNYLILETATGRTISIGAMSSDLNSRISILQTLLINMSKLPLEQFSGHAS